MYISLTNLVNWIGKLFSWDQPQFVIQKRIFMIRVLTYLTSGLPNNIHTLISVTLHTIAIVLELVNWMVLMLYIVHSFYTQTVKSKPLEIIWTRKNGDCFEYIWCCWVHKKRLYSRFHHYAECSRGFRCIIYATCNMFLIVYLYSYTQSLRKGS